MVKNPPHLKPKHRKEIIKSFAPPLTLALNKIEQQPMEINQWTLVSEVHCLKRQQAMNFNGGANPQLAKDFGDEKVRQR